MPPSRISDEGLTPDFLDDASFFNIDSTSTGFSASGSGKFDRFEMGQPGSAPGSSTNTPRQVVKKEKNRGSYRCGRCGKPKVKGCTCPTLCLVCCAHNCTRLLF
jgi:hypothetical protein